MSSLARVMLAAFPVVMLLGAVPFVNRVEPRVAGLPFFLAWDVFWVAVTPLFLIAADRFRKRA